MVVCQFFLRGNCRFGERCRKEHPMSSNPTSVLPSTKPTEGRESRDEDEDAVPPSPPISQAKISEEMEGRWVGPMPAQQFIDSFFDSTNPSREKPDGCTKNWKTHFKSLGAFGDATEMCNHVQGLITTSEAAPGMQVHRVLPQYNVIGYSPSETTLALYADGDPLHLESMQLCITTKLSTPPKQKQKQNEDPKGDDHWHKEYCEISANLKVAKGCALCRDELVSHAKALMNYQHRTHVFIVHMVDPYARLIRFDRDGAIVSARFNYREHGDLLLGFLWRFSNATSEARGRDPSVTRATVEEAALAREKLPKWFSKYHDRPVYKLVIRDQELVGSTEKKKEMEVLVLPPVFRQRSLVGSATKYYVGYDRGTDKIVFVKDTWRSADPSMVKETDTLRAINSAGITKGVPVLLCGDDLEGRWQSTITPEYSQQNWNIGGQFKGTCRHIHTRFVTDKVGRPIEKSKASKDFLKAICDAFRAHKVVYDKCQILHCDISMGNILVTADGKGFLNNWEQARSIENVVSGPHRDFRTGTWRFMSASLLLRPKKIHTLQDDIESFFWVPAFMILCFLKHNWTSQAKLIMESVYDERQRNVRTDGIVLGGTGKFNHLAYFLPVNDPLVVQGNKPLTVFFERCRRLVLAQHLTESGVRSEVKFKTTERDLERDVYRALRDKAPSSPLTSHAAFEAAFVEALAADGWPVNDSAQGYAEEAVQTSAGKKRKADEMQDYSDENSRKYQGRRT